MKLFITKKSFKIQLVEAFLLASIIPVFIITAFSYINSSKLVKDNIDSLVENNLEQINSSLTIWLESYEDIVYQLYTDDNIVELVEKLNRREDTAVSVNQLRRQLRAIQDSKDYIESITIITKENFIVNCDILTPVTTENSWIENFSLSQTQIYNQVSKDNYLHMFSTEYAATFANKDYYLFHMAHRIINYKDIEKEIGIVVVSINEKLLEQICFPQSSKVNIEEGFNFIVDENGRIVSFYNQDMLMKKITKNYNDVNMRKEDYIKFIEQNDIFQNEMFEVYITNDEEFKWDIVNVTNQGKMLEKLNYQRKMLTVILVFSLLALALIIFSMLKQLTSSINKVVKNMEKTQTGNIGERIDIDRKMPVEIKTIASTFNSTMEKLKDLMQKEKEAVEKQKDAQIKVLEAQINPHFLYNTLDTINWMAIDKEEYEISNSISSLAGILRYAIDKSNETVSVNDEIEWLKKYIFLQQTRLKNMFRCEIEVSEDAKEIKIHKLILEPFVENAILHGFEGIDREHKLKIEIKKNDSKLLIYIEDNGKGMKKEKAKMYEKGIFNSDDNKTHMGIENAVSRINMYYGEKAKVELDSEIGEGTKVGISIEYKEGKTSENSNS